jgi:hypothetical protein
MKFLTALLLIFINIGCSKRKATESKDTFKFPETIHAEYENKNFKLYEENATLRPIFDSLTELVKNCPNNKYKDKVLYIGLSNQGDTLQTISIDLMDKNKLYCEYVYGIIVRNQKYLILSPDCKNDPLFLNTGLNVNFTCRKEDIFIHDFKDWRDGWNFILAKGKFRFIAYSICGNGWYDEKYYKFD